MICFMQRKLDLCSLGNWQCSSSASPEQLFCICFYSSSNSRSRCWESPLATVCQQHDCHPAPLTPVQPGARSAAMSSQNHWHWRIRSVVCVLVLCHLYIRIANLGFNHASCSSPSLKPPEKRYNPIGSHFHDTCL